MKFWTQKLALAKIEATYGTDAAPAVADAVLFANVQFSPIDGGEEPRGVDRPWMGNEKTFATDLVRRLRFEVDLAPSGTAGTAPAWGRLLRACGCAEVVTPVTSVAYNPVSSGFESVTIHFVVDGTRFALVGARGDATFRVEASRKPVIAFDMTGLYVAPTEIAQPTPDFTAWKEAQISTSVTTPTFSVSGVNLGLRRASLSFGNRVVPRFLSAAASPQILIEGRADRIEATVEAVALGTLDPFALAAANSAVALSLVHGTGAGKIATLAVPSAQVLRPTGLENANNLVEWPLAFAPLPTTGNDQWTLTLT